MIGTDVGAVKSSVTGRRPVGERRERDDRQSPRGLALIALVGIVAGGVPFRTCLCSERDDAAMLIRRDRPADHIAVRAVLADAFKNPARRDVPVEIGLGDALRASSEWIPQLSMVAESDEGTVVGYVVCTCGWVDGRPALGLGPVGGRPGHATPRGGLSSHARSARSR